MSELEQEILQRIEELEDAAMKQDDNQAAQTSQPGMAAPRRPTAAESRRWLEEHMWTLPLLDECCADEILGDADDGIC